MRILFVLCALLLMPVVALAATQNAVLTWVDTPNETGYKIERRVCGTGTYTPVGTTLAGVATFTDVNLTQGTNFGWHVIAFNAIGDAIPSDELCMTTAGIPGKVGGLSVTIQIVP